MFVGLFGVMAWKAGAFPTTFAVIGDSLPPGRRATAFSVQSILVRVPRVIGAPIGGLLIGSLGVIAGVRTTLLATLALGLGVLALQRYGFREDGPPSPRSDAGRASRDRRRPAVPSSSVCSSPTVSSASVKAWRHPSSSCSSCRSVTCRRRTTACSTPCSRPSRSRPICPGGASPIEPAAVRSSRSPSCSSRFSLSRCAVADDLPCAPGRLLSRRAQGNRGTGAQVADSRSGAGRSTCPSGRRVLWHPQSGGRPRRPRGRTALAASHPRCRWRLRSSSASSARRCSLSPALTRCPLGRR